MMTIRSTLLVLTSALAGCAGTSTMGQAPATVHPKTDLARSATLCPAAPLTSTSATTTILSDGDFSQADHPGHHIT